MAAVEEKVISLPRAAIMTFGVLFYTYVNSPCKYTVIFSVI